MTEDRQTLRRVGQMERLAEIEFRIAEIFAQLTGDTPS